MTARAPNWFETKYRNGAIHVLQDAGYRTKGLFAEATSINGKEVVFKIAGSGEATEMNSGLEDVPTLNADRTTVTATLADWEANEWIKTTDLMKMSENDQQIAQKTCAMAIGRRFDRIPMAAMDAEASNITTIGDGSALISPADLLAGQADILDGGVEGEPIINVGVTYKMMSSLLTFKAVSSADYCDDSPLLKKIGARMWLGMRIIPFPAGTFNNPTGTQRDGYMWLSDCVGRCTPTDAEGKIGLATRIDYVPTKKAYLAANTMSAAAKTILTAGVRRLRFNNVAPSSLSNL